MKVMILVYFPFNVCRMYSDIPSVPDFDDLCLLSFFFFLDQPGQRFIHFIDLFREPTFDVIFFSLFCFNFIDFCSYLVLCLICSFIFLFAVLKVETQIFGLISFFFSVISIQYFTLPAKHCLTCSCKFQMLCFNFYTMLNILKFPLCSPLTLVQLRKVLINFPIYRNFSRFFFLLLVSSLILLTVREHTLYGLFYGPECGLCW